MPKITIDGVSLAAEEGQTILEVAREAGVYIPTLCYHPKVGQSAVCRICAVEVEGARGLVMACNAKVTDGMVVNTTTPTVLQARRTVVELLLASGDHDCLACEMCGRCELQEVAYRLGIKAAPYRIERKPLPLDESHPMILRDPNKCIHCYRCIRGCNEIVVNEVLDMGYRGNESQVVADQMLPLGESSCVGCGECVQLCPTGALIEKKAQGTGRVWDLDIVQSTCPYCGVGCQLDLHVDRKANRVVKVTGHDSVPNHGMLCVKGRFAYDFPASDKRLTGPLMKIDGKLQEVSWERALDHTAQRLTEIRDAHGPDAICGVGSARDTNENCYAVMKFLRAVVKTNNVDHCART
jgi:formate dehydrogenase major subunit